MFLSRQLIQFFSVAENSSLAEAAEKLNLTPSALSHGIHDLECKTGILLIKRSGQKSSLTIAGRELYQQLLPYYIRIKHISDNLSGKKKNNNSLTIKTDSLCYSPLKDKIMSFCKENPDLSLSLESHERIDIKHEIPNTNTDIVISSDCSTDNDDIHHLDLPPEETGIIVHDSLLKKHASISALVMNERHIKIKTKIHENILSKFLSTFKIALNDHLSITIPAEYNISDFIASASGFSLLPENSLLIDNLKNRGCRFIKLPHHYNILIKRRVYFREIHNQTISDFILKIRSN
ncbi:LysR family transcriptional regulator [Morganella morganii]|uniref:LysR family transcriptional regulator n=1 Tax=Morganella morganii TaxID=582 RepID=UPI0021CFB257|nr:LysR family transcriptional regulator [Morganella morganii]MCU6213283.1 LysR family transcriptional regulator [Morganella morganii]MCU6238146.1 LysR family transcriptional regulator [Morganella morganii]